MAQALPYQDIDKSSFERITPASAWITQ